MGILKRFRASKDRELLDLVNSTLTRESSIGFTPDYGLDRVLLEEVGVTVGKEELKGSPLSEAVLAKAFQGCVQIVHHAMTTIDAGYPGHGFRFWQAKRMPLEFVSISDDVIALKALETMVAGDSELAQAHPSFRLDTLDHAAELIRRKNEDWLGHNERDTMEWMSNNPIADGLLTLCRLPSVEEFMLNQTASIDQIHPDALNTRFMYIID